MLATIAAEVKGSGPTVSRTHCFAPILPDPWLLQSFYPLFLSGPWTLEGRGAVCFPLWLSTPQTLLCSLTVCEFLPYPLSTILRKSLWGLSSTWVCGSYSPCSFLLPASLLHSLIPNRLLLTFLSCSWHFTYQGNHGLCETVKVMDVLKCFSFSFTSMIPPTYYEATTNITNHFLNEEAEF